MTPTMFRTNGAHAALVAFSLLLLTTITVAACDSSGSENGGDEPTVEQTFAVSVQSVDSSYPYRNSNQIGVAFAVDGDLGKELTLERGKTYEFVLGTGVSPNHPLYIGDTAEGQGGDEFTDGVQNAKSTSGSVFFTPPQSAPDSLFYVCDNHVFMGGKMNITDGQ